MGYKKQVTVPIAVSYHGLMPLPRRTQTNVPPTIALTSDGFEIISRADCHDRIAFANIVSIAAFKRDELTTDLVCFAFTTDTPGGLVEWILHEDTQGFDELAERLATLPGFLKAWRQKVIPPAFSPNEALLFQRPG